MSEHVGDRLSAYLDRELGVADHDAVLAHLRGCEACRSHLAALTAVDKAARALPVEAPAGYFDTLPGRVRARLETTSAGNARVSRPTIRPPLGRLPAWTWAVAAALLLAVVVPITVHERRTSLTPPPAPEASPAVPAAPPTTLTGRVAGYAPAPAGEPARIDAVGRKAPAEELKIAAPEKRGLEAGAGLAARVEPKPAARPLSVAPPPAPATAMPAEARSTELASGAAAEKRQRAPGLGGPYAQAPAQSQAQIQTSADQAADRAAVRSLTEEIPAADAREGARDKEEAAPSLAKSARERDEQGRRGTGALANRVPPADAQEFSRLETTAAQTVDALRARREAWRKFALHFPASPRADEARVRIVETGAEAWRLGRDPRDREQVREDAAAYLDRKDAAQKARMRALLGSVEGP